MKIGAAILAAVVLVMAAAFTFASLAWSRGSRREAERLRAGVAQAPAAAPGRDASLPAPVARFLDRATPADGRAIAFARLEQEGEFLLRAPAGWAPFTATQFFRAEPPAFLWDARVRMAPFLQVRVRDSYVGGVGSMHGAVGGIVTVVRAEGTPEMASGSLYRFLAESAWIPTRLRPSPTLRWEPIDDTRALATLTDGETRVAVEFRFDVEGDIVGIHVPERAREVDGTYELAPWTGHFRDHRDIGGVRIPTRGEVAWVVNGEETPYWKGRVVDAEYAFH